MDVLNPKPASTSQVPSSLFNTLPHTQSAPAIFVPGGAAGKCQLSCDKQGPVVQSIGSLTILLEVKMLTVLVITVSNSQVFFSEKM